MLIEITPATLAAVGSSYPAGLDALAAKTKDNYADYTLLCNSARMIETLVQALKATFPAPSAKQEEI